MPFGDNTNFRSGFITLAGRPNAGKSTFLNALMGQKIAITTPVPQSTRTRLKGIITTDVAQLIVVDTPGLHKPHDVLGQELNHTALTALQDVDIIAHTIDVTQNIGTGDEWVYEHIKKAGASFTILIFTKADIADPTQVSHQIEIARRLFDYDDMLVVSAKTGYNTREFIELVSTHLPLGPLWYPPEDSFDQSDENLVASFVQEKLCLHLKEELPHALGVFCNEIEFVSDTFARIEVVVYTERESQKKIVIGKNGSMIKKVGTEARFDIERLFGHQVYLSLKIKVHPHWREDMHMLSRLGYQSKD